MIQSNKMTSTYLSEWPKHRTLTAPNEKHLIARRHTTFSATLKDSLAVFYKTEHAFSILLSNYTLCSNSMKTYSYKRKMHTDFL